MQRVFNTYSPESFVPKYRSVLKKHTKKKNDVKRKSFPTITTSKEKEKKGVKVKIEKMSKFNKMVLFQSYKRGNFFFFFCFWCIFTHLQVRYTFKMFLFHKCFLKKMYKVFYDLFLFVSVNLCLTLVRRTIHPGACNHVCSTKLN